MNAIEIESKEIRSLSNLLTEDFQKSNWPNTKFIWKIAASLTSTGTPSFFLHPGEAYHGDLGMAEEEDIDNITKQNGFLENELI